MECFKGFFDMVWNRMMVSLQDLGQYLQNKLFWTWVMWKVRIHNKNCAFSERIFYACKQPTYTEIHIFLSQYMFCTEIVQNQMLKIKIWHFEIPCYHSILKKILKFPLYPFLLILYPRSENSITGIAIMNIYSDVIKSFLIHTASLFFATAKLLCGLLTTIHHHYKFISKKILRLLDNLRNAPVSTLNHDLSFVLYCQSKIRIKVLFV